MLFTVLGGKFKFSAQDSDLEYLCWKCKKSPVSSDLKPPLGEFKLQFQKKIILLCNIVTTRAQAAVDIKRKCYWSFQIKSLPSTRPCSMSIIEFAMFLLPYRVFRSLENLRQLL